MTAVLGPVPCIACRKSVWWDRVGEYLRLMEGHTEHVCRAIPCGQWMRYANETCARQRGHRGAHARRVVMDDRAALRRRRAA